MVKFIPKKKPRPPISENPSVKKVNGFLHRLRWLDPFTYVDLWVMPRVKARTQSKGVEYVVNILFAFLFAFILYTILGLLFGTGSPLVVVYSGSMEPVLFRGDVMGLKASNTDLFFGPEVVLNSNIKNVPVSAFASPTYGAVELESLTFSNGVVVPYKKEGSIVVYSAFNPAIPSFNGKPIIHRAFVKIKALDGTFVLTKGDNSETNKTFDADCGRVDPLRQISENPCITFYAIPVNEVQGVAFFNLPKVGCVKLWLFDDLLSIATTGKLPADFKGIC